MRDLHGKGADAPFDSAGHERRRSSVAHADEGAAAPHGAARIDEADPAARLEPVSDPGGWGAHHYCCQSSENQKRSDCNAMLHLVPAGARATSASTKPGPARETRAELTRSGSALETSFSHASQLAASARFTVRTTRPSAS